LPDARRTGGRGAKAKLKAATEVGYVTQLAEVTEHTKPGARRLILPVSTTLGNPSEKTLLSDIVAELGRLGISPREVGAGRRVHACPDQQRRTSRKAATSGSL
jgi:hypothetical protein